MQPPIKQVLGGGGVLSLRVMRPGSEAAHSPPSSAEVKVCIELYLHFSNTSSRRCAQLSTGTTLPLHYDIHRGSLLNPKVHSCVHKGPPLSRILNSAFLHPIPLRVVFISFHLQLCVSGRPFAGIFWLKCCMCYGWSVLTVVFINQYQNCLSSLLILITL
jgi:hypothetical protein